MNALERLQACMTGQKADRVPYVPAIYGHAASLIGETPTAIAVDEDLLAKAHLAAYRRYGYDLITVGADIYNVEAEALGCRISYFHDGDTIPGIATHILQHKHLDELAVPSPWIAGRMPLLLAATAKVKATVDQEVQVNGAVIGPFTLAALLLGFEQFAVEMLTEPEYASQILDFTLSVVLAFAKAFVGLGVGVTVNECWLSPPVLSPALYREFVKERHAALVTELRRAGAAEVTLAGGGDTTAVLDDLIATGAAPLVADCRCDQEYFRRRTRQAGIPMRGSLDSRLIRNGPPDAIVRQARRILHACAEGGRFMLGCGLVACDTPPEHILALKQAAEEYAAFGFAPA